MPVEKSAGAVIFCRRKNKIEYLLIRSSENSHWGFSKGHIESNEKPEEAALREVGEETGLKKIKVIDGFKETIRYFFKVKFAYQAKKGWKRGDSVLKFVTYFLAEAKNRKVKLSFEHSAHQWLGVGEALVKLFPADRKILEKADKFLRNKPK